MQCGRCMGCGLVCHSEFCSIMVFIFTSRRQIKPAMDAKFSPLRRSLAKHFLIDHLPTHMGFAGMRYTPRWAQQTKICSCTCSPSGLTRPVSKHPGNRASFQPPTGPACHAKTAGWHHQQNLGSSPLLSFGLGQRKMIRIPTGVRGQGDVAHARASRGASPGASVSRIRTAPRQRPSGNGCRPRGNSYSGPPVEPAPFKLNRLSFAGCETHPGLKSWPPGGGGGRHSHGTT